MHSRPTFTFTAQSLRFGLCAALASLVVATGSIAQGGAGTQKGSFASIPGLPDHDLSATHSPPPQGIQPQFDDPHLQQRGMPAQEDGKSGLDAIVVDKDFKGPQNTGSYPANPAIATGPNHVLTAVSSVIP